MKYLMKVSDEYNKSLKSHSLLFISFIFIILIFILNILTFQTFKEIPKILMESNFDFLTINVCRSTIIDNEEGLIKLEKVEKLNKQELTSLSRYIGDFQYCDSIEPVLNNVVIKQKNEEINVKIVPVFPNDVINKEMNFCDLAWNEVIANENFINKYNCNDLTITFESTIQINGIFEFVSFKNNINIVNYHKDMDYDNGSYLYINLLKFNSFLDSLILNNVSSSRNEYYSFLDALKDDNTGEIFNSYNYIIGVQSADDFYELMSISETNNIELSSNPINSYQSNKSTFELVEIVSKFFLYITSFSIFLICIIQSYILVLNKIKDIGYFLSIGMEYNDTFVIIFNPIYKEFIKAILLDFLMIIIVYLILSLFISINTFLNIKKLLLVLVFTLFFMSLIIFLITSLCFTILMNKKVSSLLRVE